MNNKFKYRLIIGLGNPGSRYDSTYHNAGQLTAERLMKMAAETMTLAQKGKQKNFEYFKFANGRGLIFIKPLTFMNESGEAAAESLKRFGVKPEETLVIHDDADIELGKSKLSFGRGSGGHHGIESIINGLKTKKFWRLRIGIRPKTSSVKRQAPKIKKAGLPAEAYRAKAGEMVLKKITPADKLVLERLFSNLNPVRSPRQKKFL